MLREWDDLPEFMRIEEVRPYYDSLREKKRGLLLKRWFDFIVSLMMLILLSPIMGIIAFLIALDSKGGVFFRQERVTQYGRKFKIFKFRTMVANAEKLGAQVTAGNDMRVTKMGKMLRKVRLDELPQLLNILLGDMSFVGTRPEVPRYVEAYSSEMMATLLLPAGVTSEASIKYKDEDRLLSNSVDVNKTYIEEVLPEKMKYNLESVLKYSFRREIFIMIKTVFAVLEKN